MSKKVDKDKYDLIDKKMNAFKRMLNIIFSLLIILSGVILNNILFIGIGLLVGCIGFYIIKDNDK